MMLGADQLGGLSSMLLFAVPEAVLCHDLVRSRSAGQSNDLVLLPVPEPGLGLNEARSRSAGHLSTAPTRDR